LDEVDLLFGFKKIFRDANLNNKNDSVVNENKKAPQRDAFFYK
jgi:hypothetical protein